MAIKSSTRKAVKLYHVDVNAAGNYPGIVRPDIISKLDKWNEDGVISLKTSGTQHVYNILRKLPSTPQEIDDIMEKLYAQMLGREQRDLQRTKEVIRLITSKACISRGLAAYFGDSSHGLSTECGHCTWCETHSQIILPDRQPLPPSRKLIDAILKACNVRDDPRFLARIAFGITSPRVTTLRLGKHPVFRSMNGCDFMVRIVFFSLLAMVVIVLSFSDWSRYLGACPNVRGSMRERRFRAQWCSTPNVAMDMRIAYA